MNERDDLELNKNACEADSTGSSENDFDIDVEELQELIDYHESRSNYRNAVRPATEEENMDAEKETQSTTAPESASVQQTADNATENKRRPAENKKTYPYDYEESFDEDYYYDDLSYAYDDKQGRQKGTKGLKVFAIVIGVLCVFLLVTLVSVIFGNSGGTSSEPSQNNPENVDELETNASPVTDDVPNAEGELAPKAIYKKVLPSSVGIMVYDKSKTLASEGSGVVFKESKDGKYTYIITCAHVINDATGKIRVQLSDSSEYEAVVVGYDTRTDIGVIRITASGLQLAEIGDSSMIEVGDPVYAIGNPGGVEFANSFTNGMVSALDRPVNSSSTGYTTECIQHTAAINPGNSGGALVNAFGQVIGINSMKIVADEYEGMGFSVPSSVFVKIVNEILENGYVTNRPKLGITYVPASEYSTYGMFVAIKGLPAGTIVIYEIAEDSALAGTKAEKGDMIIAANGVELDDPSYLSKLIETMNVGDKLTLTLVRLFEDYSSEEFDVTVTLVEDRGNTIIAQEEPTTSSGTYPGDYGDIFGKYFEEYFDNYYGGSQE